MTLNVVGLLLLGVEGRCNELNGGGVREVPGDGEGAEVGTEDIFLLTVEVDLERLDVLHGAETGLAVLGFELVTVL